jgi:hypothetical protein
MNFEVFTIVPVCMLVHPRLCRPTLFKAIFYSNTTTLGCVYQQALKVPIEKKKTPDLHFELGLEFFLNDCKQV